MVQNSLFTVVMIRGNSVSGARTPRPANSPDKSKVADNFQKYGETGRQKKFITVKCKFYSLKYVIYLFLTGEHSFITDCSNGLYWPSHVADHISKNELKMNWK